MKRCKSTSNKERRRMDSTIHTCEYERPCSPTWAPLPPGKFHQHIHTLIGNHGARPDILRQGQANSMLDYRVLQTKSIH